MAFQGTYIGSSGHCVSGLEKLGRRAQVVFVAPRDPVSDTSLSSVISELHGINEVPKW